MSEGRKGGDMFQTKKQAAVSELIGPLSRELNSIYIYRFSFWLTMALAHCHWFMSIDDDWYGLYIFLIDNGISTLSLIYVIWFMSIDDDWYGCYMADIWLIYGWYMTDIWLIYADADAVTPSSNTRSYTLRSVPSQQTKFSKYISRENTVNISPQSTLYIGIHF